jgi:regulation of enolase protein 1 (concanavalin A-like superfamily)
MSRILSRACIVLFATSLPLGAQTVPSDDGKNMSERWGKVTDPDADCQVHFERGKVTIQVPGSPHDLSVEQNRLNAPRILRDAQGDFIAQVRVAGQVRPGGASSVAQRTPYNGAGLLVWIDRGTYLRLERAAITRPGAPDVLSYVNYELRRDGKPATPFAHRVPDGPLFVRLERHGNEFIGSVSPDGLSWQSLGKYELPPQGTAQIGVVAVNSASEPFKAELEGFALYTKQAPY